MQFTDILRGINNINDKILPEFSIVCMRNSVKCQGFFYTPHEQFYLKLDGLLVRPKVNEKWMWSFAFTLIPDESDLGWEYVVYLFSKQQHFRICFAFRLVWTKLKESVRLHIRLRCLLDYLHHDQESEISTGNYNVMRTTRPETSSRWKRKCLVIVRLRIKLFASVQWITWEFTPTCPSGQ